MFITVTSRTDPQMRWFVNVTEIVMLRRKSAADECVVVLTSGGTLEPKESYAEVCRLIERIVEGTV